MKEKNLLKTSSGFTLIELLVVIAIISVLASAIIVAITPAERIREARDAKRKSDTGQIVNALQAYYAAYGRFPLENLCDSSKGTTTTGSICFYSSNNPPAGTDWSTTSGIYQLVTQGFIKRLPIDPKNTGNYAINDSYYYRYEPVPTSLQITDATEQCGKTGEDICAYYYIAARLEYQGGAYTWRCGDRPNMTNPVGCREVPYTIQQN